MSQSKSNVSMHHMIEYVSSAGITIFGRVKLISYNLMTSFDRFLSSVTSTFSSPPQLVGTPAFWTKGMETTFFGNISSAGVPVVLISVA